MSERLIRIYKKFYIDEIKAHLMTYGALSGTCAQCKELDIKLDALTCPGCGNEFKYMAFQNVRDHLPKIQKIMHERPQILFIDYDDFKKAEGEEKARGILE